jgi:hypothetical protein
VLARIRHGSIQRYAIAATWLARMQDSSIAFAIRGRPQCNARRRGLSCVAVIRQIISVHV